MRCLLKSLATPVVWVVALMVLGFMLTSRLPKKRRFKLGRWALFLGICILLLLSTRPVSELLVYSLEHQYQVPSDEVLSTLNIVAILGGGMSVPGGLRKDYDPSRAAYSRLVNGVRMFKRSSAETLALSGGSQGSGFKSEAEVLEALALELGVPDNQIVTETKSHNTMENGVNLAILLPSSQNRRIGLVTSALHMPRSMKVFRKQFPNDTIVPIPVNHLYSPNWSDFRSYIPSPDSLVNSHCAIHEWIGMIWYIIRY